MLLCIPTWPKQGTDSQLDLSCTLTEMKLKAKMPMKGWTLNKQGVCYWNESPWLSELCLDSANCSLCLSARIQSLFLYICGWGTRPNVSVAPFPTHIDQCVWEKEPRHPRVKSYPGTKDSPWAYNVVCKALERKTLCNGRMYWHHLVTAHSQFTSGEPCQAEPLSMHLVHLAVSVAPSIQNYNSYCAGSWHQVLCQFWVLLMTSSIKTFMWIRLYLVIWIVKNSFGSPIMKLRLHMGVFKNVYVTDSHALPSHIFLEKI